MYREGMVMQAECDVSTTSALSVKELVGHLSFKTQNVININETTLFEFIY